MRKGAAEKRGKWDPRRWLEKTFYFCETRRESEEDHKEYIAGWGGDRNSGRCG